MTGTAPETSYDRVPYIGYSFQQTHPDRLATAATLFGLSPAPIDRCRVLEIGCGDGGNLVPMGLELPQSRFVGIDLAAQPVARGQAMAAELGVANVELRALDVMELGEEFGEFDYIIAHGIYSWVPAAVRDRMMEICRRHLAPNGVAYISYNAYPGWHLWQVGREMMRFHTRDMPEPEEKVAQGLAILKFMTLNYQGERMNDLYGTVIREHLDKLSQYRHREHIFHDDLGEINEPFYFYQFAQHAAQHGLQYLAEAELFEMQSYIYPPPIREMLAQFPDEQVVLKEQYLDFLKGRVFRQTLLCRAEVKLDRRLASQRITNLYLTSLANPSSAQPDLRAGVVEEFDGPKGGRLQTDFPLAKAALLELREAKPQPLKFHDLVGRAQRRLRDAGLAESAEADEADVTALTEILFSACQSGLARLRVSAPPLVAAVSERPQASVLARYQARYDSIVTNLLHEKVEIDSRLGVALLGLLDGTRDRAALIEALAEIAWREKLISPAEGASEWTRQQVREVVEQGIDASLNKFARTGLLSN